MYYHERITMKVLPRCHFSVSVLPTRYYHWSIAAAVLPKRAVYENCAQQCRSECKEACYDRGGAQCAHFFANHYICCLRGQAPQRETTHISTIVSGRFLQLHFLGYTRHLFIGSRFRFLCKKCVCVLLGRGSSRVWTSPYANDFALEKKK